MTDQEMKIHHIGNGMRTSDGDGVNIYRVLSPQVYQATNPFLMLDEIRSDKSADFIGGFPEHPHRGFDTITFMFQGGFEHRDSLGNEEIIAAGGVQRMRTGSGIRHSEMPVPDEKNQIHGFQLWLNIPAKDKLIPPAYEDADKDNVPVVKTENGASMRVISGVQNGIKGRWYEEERQLTILDIQLEKGQTLSVEEIADKRGIIYMVDGEVNFVNREPEKPEIQASQGQFLVFDTGTRSHFSARKTSRLLYLSARAINEPVAHYGPFVMNTEQEIHQAISDFQSGKF